MRNLRRTLCGTNFVCEHPDCFNKYPRVRAMYSRTFDPLNRGSTSHDYTCEAHKDHIHESPDPTEGWYLPGTELVAMKDRYPERTKVRATTPIMTGGIPEGSIGYVTRFPHHEVYVGSYIYVHFPCWPHDHTLLLYPHQVEEVT